MEWTASWRSSALACISRWQRRRKIAQKGNRIVLEADGGFILNKATGKKIPLTVENGVYMMEMCVKPAAPFQGQAKS